MSAEKGTSILLNQLRTATGETYFAIRDAVVAGVGQLEEEKAALTAELAAVKAEKQELMERLVQNTEALAQYRQVKAERDAALRDAERVRVAVFEFINDWRKGDFALPELAQYDVMAIIETYKAIDAAREG